MVVCLPVGVGVVCCVPCGEGCCGVVLVRVVVVCVQNFQSRSQLRGSSALPRQSPRLWHRFVALHVFSFHDTAGVSRLIDDCCGHHLYYRWFSTCIQARITSKWQVSTTCVPCGVNFRSCASKFRRRSISCSTVESVSTLKGHSTCNVEEMHAKLKED